MVESGIAALLVELATGLWRSRDKLADADGIEDPDGVSKLLRSLSRQLTSMADALADFGVDVQAHTGQPYEVGQALQVIAFAPSHSVATETVVETIMPTVYIGGRVAQMGQVVVAVPGPSPVPTAAELAENDK